MRTQRVVLWSSLFAAGVAVMAGYSSCGGTGGGVSPLEAFLQFVSQSCSPAGPNGGGNCLTLSVPNAVNADGRTLSGFRAKLVDGSGSPLPGVQICFAFENPRVATIVEPTNACGLTDQNGFISGQFRDGVNTGSFALVATAPAGFGLQTRRTISFNGSKNPTFPGNVGAPCGQPGDTACSAGLFCTNNTTCFSNVSTCQAPQGAGGCCAVDAECASGCNFDTGQCKAAGGSPQGSSCSQGTDCASGACAASVCLGAVGDGCAVNADCASGICNGVNSVCTNMAPTPTPTP